MAHTVIYLFGASGSGTTTLGKYISQKICGFFMDTDDYYWMPVDPPYTVKRDIPDRAKSLEKNFEIIYGYLI